MVRPYQLLRGRPILIIKGKPQGHFPPRLPILQIKRIRYKPQTLTLLPYSKKLTVNL